MSTLMGWPRLAQSPKSVPFTLTVFQDTRLRPNPGTPSQCCVVPGDVSACCASQVRRDRAFQTSSLFKKKLR